MAVNIHIDVHDGPMDVLLALIQKNEINIYDIPISQITEQFLEYIHSAEQVGLQDLSDFYRMAADLIWIKSQLLLPRQKIDVGGDYEDPREELVERLLEYSKFRKYSELLLGNDNSQAPAIQRKPTQFRLPFSDQELWENAGVSDLLDAFVKLLKGKVADEKVFNVYEQVTEQEKIALMLELLETRQDIRFSELFARDCSAMHIICSFMAVLEATKDRTILTRQERPFSEIFITKRPPDWNPNLADDYDDEYDRMKEHGLEDEDDFSIASENEEDGQEEEDVTE